MVPAKLIVGAGVMASVIVLVAISATGVPESFN
jgi:hypothetical protein